MPDIATQLRTATTLSVIALTACAPVNHYDQGWIYTGALTKPVAPIVTVSDARYHVSPSSVERPSAENGNRCIIHMPASSSEWQLTREQWYADWLKEANLCTREADGGFVPDGNSPEGSQRHELALGYWKHVSDNSSGYAHLAVSWGAPEPPAGVIGTYRQPEDQWAWP